MTKLEKLENQLAELQEEYKSINPYFKNKKQAKKDEINELKKQIKILKENQELKEALEEKSEKEKELKREKSDLKKKNQILSDCAVSAIANKSTAEEFKSLVDLLDKTVKEKNYYNVKDWANCAKTKGLVNEQEKCRIHGLMNHRHNDSHAGIGDFVPTKSVIDFLKNIIEIANNDVEK